MHICARLVLSLGVILTAAGTAAAQEARVQLAVKGGVTIENSEDGLTGTVPAFGLTAAVPFASRWRGEFEFWLPGYLEDARGEPKHRDILYSFSAVRLFGDGPVRPLVVAGLSVSRTEDRFTFCTATRGGTGALVSCDEPDVTDVRLVKDVGTGSYLLAGGGVEITLSRRIAALADVRVSLAPTSVLVRPGLGLALRF